MCAWCFLSKRTAQWVKEIAPAFEAGASVCRLLTGIPKTAPGLFANPAIDLRFVYGSELVYAQTYEESRSPTFVAGLATLFFKTAHAIRYNPPH